MSTAMNLEMNQEINPTMSPVLSCYELGKTYAQGEHQLVVLDKINLSVAQGERCAIRKGRTFPSSATCPSACRTQPFCRWDQARS